MDSNYYLYQHKNKINNKSYIGITCQKPIYRWGHNGHNYRLQPKFYNAIQKYGWDNFDHNILYNNLSQKEAIELEKEYIKKYNSIDNGYNISLGSDSESKIKQIRCITTGDIFDSVSDGAKFANVHPSNLSACLHGKWQTSGKKDGIKLEWSFVLNKYNTDKEKKEEERYIKILEKNKKIKEQTELFIYEYTVENKPISYIAKKYGVAKSTVSKRLKERNINVISAKDRNKKEIEMYDVNHNFVICFNSLTEALNYINVSENNMSRLKNACLNNTMYKEYYWKYKT